jgi:hypothetical protein
MPSGTKTTKNLDSTPVNFVISCSFWHLPVFYNFIASTLFNFMKRLFFLLLVLPIAFSVSAQTPGL